MGMRRGVFRVAKAVKILGHVFGWMAVAFGVWLGLGTTEGWGALLVFGIVGAVVIGVGHGAAWVIEGFAPEG